MYTNTSGDPDFSSTDPQLNNSLNEYSNSIPFLCWLTLNTGWMFTPILKSLFIEIDTEFEPSPSANPPKKIKVICIMNIFFHNFIVLDMTVSGLYNKGT